MYTLCFSRYNLTILQFFKINKFPKIEILNSIGRSKVHSRDLFNFPNLNSEIFYLYLEPHSFQHKHDKPRHPSAFLRLLCTLKCCSILTIRIHPQQIFSSLVTSRFRQRVNKRRWLGSRRTRESSNPFTRIHAVVISA